MVKNKVILVVDDEANIRELLSYNLVKEGYDVITAEEGNRALDLARTTNFDLILLDVMLPGKNGFDICKELRVAYHVDTPIIMLTAKGEELDRILGLEFGADDYVAKPFSIRELTARIKAVIRRYESKGVAETEPIKEENLEINNIVINSQRHEVLKDGEVVELTLKEFDLLKCLVRNRGRVMTREYLLETIWGFEYTGETRTVDVHIRYLRKKLDDNFGEFIQTIRGVGYRIS